MSNPSGSMAERGIYGAAGLRSVSAAGGINNARGVNNIEDEDRPPLPQRPGGSHLMDDAEDAGLGGWKPLVPGK